MVYPLNHLYATFKPPLRTSLKIVFRPVDVVHKRDNAQNDVESSTISTKEYWFYYWKIHFGLNYVYWIRIRLKGLKYEHHILVWIQIPEWKKETFNIKAQLSAINTETYRKQMLTMVGLAIANSLTWCMRNDTMVSNL